MVFAFEVIIYGANFVGKIHVQIKMNNINIDYILRILDYRDSFKHCILYIIAVKMYLLNPMGNTSRIQ